MRIRLFENIFEKKFVEFNTSEDPAFAIADGPNVCWSDSRGCFYANDHSQNAIPRALPFTSTRLVGLLNTGK